MAVRHQIISDKDVASAAEVIAGVNNLKYVSPLALAGASIVPVNLTGPITSVGNATSVASQTGTGSKFVMDTSPTINTPTLVSPSISQIPNLNVNGFIKTTGGNGTLAIDTTTYLVSEVDTLASVTARGASTAQDLTFTGLLAIASLSPALVQKSADYTLLTTDYTVECTANSFNITLPTAVGHTRVYNIKNTGSGVVTVLTTSGQTIDGQASGFWQLNQWSNMKVQSNGTNWIIL